MCCNVFINHVDCVIKRDVYSQKMHSCSKNIRGISSFVLKISVVYKKYIKYIMSDIAWIFAYLKDNKVYKAMPLYPKVPSILLI